MFFATLENVRVVLDELGFDSLQDLVASSMKTYSRYQMEAQDTPEVKKFLSRAERVEFESHCVDELIRTRLSICVCPLVAAQYHVGRNLDPHRRPLMKIAGASFREQFTALC